MEDAAIAVEAGADGLGFIFVEQSPRHIDPERARDIIGQLPPFITVFGVFVDQEITVVEEIAQYCRLNLLQLHGEESPADCGRLARPVVKAFRIGPECGPSVLAPYEGVVCAFLLDTYQRGLAGGTGQTFDWNIVRGLQSRHPIILAGGLTPDNVAAAIGVAHPYAVDVNSGVESQPGIKDAALLRSFMRQVKDTDAGGF
jgi:phosphoribosylanthranilate isomerase